MIEVKLTRPHKQGDVQYYEGDTVLLDLDTANWLVSTGLQERLDVIEAAAEIPGTPEHKASKNAIKQS